ncbi:tyrosine--tRNA ligase, partial [Mycoplasmopsis pullorum]
EFSYQLIQGWDFLTLYKDKNVCIQFGGSDQWGNITTGLDMISTTFGNDHKAVALTAQLLTDENGNKFGKSTGGGNLWLDKEMNKPFSLYQFLYNQPDSQIKNLLMWLTFLSVEEINQIVTEHEKEPAKRKAQEILAFEVVKDIHSREDAEIAKNISKIMFDKSFNQFELDTSAVEQMFSQM